MWNTNVEKATCAVLSIYDPLLTPDYTEGIHVCGVKSNNLISSFRPLL